jgi:hypothetical protein
LEGSPAERPSKKTPWVAANFALFSVGYALEFAALSIFCGRRIRPVPSITLILAGILVERLLPFAAPLILAAWLGASALTLVVVVGRYGGEEFCVLLPAMGIGEATQIAERLRAIASQTDVVQAPPRPIFARRIGGPRRSGALPGKSRRPQLRTGSLTRATQGRSFNRSSSMKKLEGPRDGTLDGHSVVLYANEEPRLIDHVVLFLCENLAAENPVLMVTTAAHRALFLDALREAGANPEAALASGQLVCLDAVATIEEILIDGRIDWRAFERSCSERVRNLRMRGPLRVYGEMVGVLWALGRHEAAMELELHWNRLRKRVDFDLLCAYEIDVFSPEFLVNEIGGIVRAHGQVLPCGGPSAA